MGLGMSYQPAHLDSFFHFKLDRFRSGTFIRSGLMPTNRQRAISRIIFFWVIASERGNVEKASGMLQASISALVAVLPETNWWISYGRSILGECATGLEHYDQAERWLVSSHAAMKQIRGPEDRYVQRAAERALRLFEAANRPEALAEFKQSQDQTEDLQPVSPAGGGSP